MAKTSVVVIRKVHSNQEANLYKQEQRNVKVKALPIATRQVPSVIFVG